jgi:hypothetical protein
VTGEGQAVSLRDAKEGTTRQPAHRFNRFNAFAYFAFLCVLCVFLFTPPTVNGRGSCVVGLK